MIFCLGEDIINELYQGNSIEQEDFIFNEFLKVIESNINVLLPESIRDLKKCFKIFKINKNKTVKRVMKYIIQTSRQYFQLLEYSNMRIVLNLILNKIEDKEIYITPQYIYDHNIRMNEPCTLLGEFIKDCKILQILSKEYFRNKLNTNFHLRMSNGGGASINQMYEMELMSNNCITLAIADSDKKFPNSHYGSTYKRLNDADISLKSNGVIHGRVEMLKVHEIENMITPSEYITNFNIRNDKLSLLRSMEKDSLASEVLLYYDLKNGIKTEDYKGELEKFYETRLKDYPDFFESEGNLIMPRFKGEICNVEIEDIHYIDADENNYIYQYRNEVLNIIYSFGLSIGGIKIN